MALSKAFEQLQKFVQFESGTLEQIQHLISNGSATSKILGSFETIKSKHTQEVVDYMYSVLGWDAYILHKISVDAETIGKKVGANQAPISLYENYENARSGWDNLQSQVKSLIEVLQPDEHYYHKVLGAILVRNYSEDYDKFVYVPHKIKPTKAELLGIAHAFNSKKLVMHSMVMDAETQKYREVNNDFVVPYTNPLKGLLFTLLALNGKFLTADEINEVTKNFIVCNHYHCFKGSFEFHGITIEANNELKVLELTLPPEMAEIVEQVRPFVLNYEHHYTP